MADNGSFQRIATTVRQGGDGSDAVFDESLNAAIESGNELTLHGLYGGYSLGRRSTGQ
jgi:hypothetical protein